MLPTRQESASKYAKQTSELQTTQILEKEKLVSNFQQQREAVRDISLGREEEYREPHTVQEELKEAQAETAAKAQAQYLQEKALLERQLNKPAMSMLGKRKDKELKRKAQALEVAVERHASQLCHLGTESLNSSPSNTGRKRLPKAG
ncbi:hypothetical protein HJG60_009266 [Phyllostomus discolor]|uniref:DUF4515 domain-containing protein n=1 Tax=Phyllostomus discolor TaxID=89673 RepID=A0A833YSD0_9CHIR|nr:hypothetical protein HJG60_009266 [Phyllostomus discolor]